ncbi:hypothetical protein Pst134EA_005401 [Puccinia striiformis f. sp. tritici]|uniref:hypothetical protein n=1 Tax=Puccinia striiformis f. sp. tritici TaxID=168172 RepID=UPI002007DB3D|nr:hypothetical protein Pst134EA_005401 [Puccinia striiformis f. sp. tritici]KAH9471506.1 hypothetical protein Pst134EA_005401 [Puccinia striiformis f. sp. tritici]KAI9627842.1 hypothetical protein H4Q26_017164 [Puccinia striiformis f. sp. tritici PST-130]
MLPKKNQKKSQQTSKANSKAPSKINTPQIPGTPLEAIPAKPLGAAVVGINFGQSASSIALINKDGPQTVLQTMMVSNRYPVLSRSLGVKHSVAIDLKASKQGGWIPKLTGAIFKSIHGKALFNSAPIIDKDGKPAYLIKPDAGEESNNARAKQILTVTDIATKYLSTLLVSRGVAKNCDSSSCTCCKVK